MLHAENIQKIRAYLLKLGAVESQVKHAIKGWNYRTKDLDLSTEICNYYVVRYSKNK